MKMSEISLLEWQKRFETEEACAAALVRVRWPEGFTCPVCAGRKYSYITSRHTYQCCQCHHQTSVTSVTISHSTNLSLIKWFWAIYLCASDKGGISALRLSKHIGVAWRTAHRILRRIRMVMAHRDSICRLEGLIGSDDALVGGKKTGKRGRGALGKTPIRVAVEKRSKRAGLMAAATVDSVNKENVREFCRRHIKGGGRQIRTDALPALKATGEGHTHEKKITPPEEAGHGLPLVHIMTGNLKTFLNGTFHGVSHRSLQDYINEFCYRFNRRF
jgi:hypothetical protein